MASSSSSSALSMLANLRRQFSATESRTKVENQYGGAGIVKVSPDVSEALSQGRAVVALESTIISHDIALVKNNALVGATIAVSLAQLPERKL